MSSSKRKAPADDDDDGSGQLPKESERELKKLKTEYENLIARLTPEAWQMICKNLKNTEATRDLRNYDQESGRIAKRSFLGWKNMEWGGRELRWIDKDELEKIRTQKAKSRQEADSSAQQNSAVVDTMPIYSDATNTANISNDSAKICSTTELIPDNQPAASTKSIITAILPKFSDHIRKDSDIVEGSILSEDELYSLNLDSTKGLEAAILHYSYQNKSKNGQLAKNVSLMKAVAATWNPQALFDNLLSLIASHKHFKPTKNQDIKDKEIARIIKHNKRAGAEKGWGKVREAWVWHATNELITSRSEAAKKTIQKGKVGSLQAKAISQAIEQLAIASVGAEWMDWTTKMRKTETESWKKVRAFGQRLDPFIKEFGIGILLLMPHESISSRLAIRQWSLATPEVIILFLKDLGFQTALQLMARVVEKDFVAILDGKKDASTLSNALENFSIKHALQLKNPKLLPEPNTGGIGIFDDIIGKFPTPYGTVGDITTVTLYHKDFVSIRPFTYMHDTALYGALLCIEDLPSTSFILDPQVLRVIVKGGSENLIIMDTITHIYMPVFEDIRDHWVLARLDVQDGQVDALVWDSMPLADGASIDTRLIIRKFVDAKFPNSKLTISEPEVAMKQDNGYDCGAVVFTNVLSQICGTNAPKELTTRGGVDVRLKMAEIILKSAKINGGLEI